MSGIDLREEPSLGLHEVTAASAEGDRFGDADILRVHERMSPNAERVLAQLQGEDFRALMLVADRVEAGKGLSEPEEEVIYDQLPGAVDLILDLFNMVSRRDERIAELEEQIEDAAMEARERDTLD